LAVTSRWTRKSNFIKALSEVKAEELPSYFDYLPPGQRLGSILNAGMTIE
jgi:hypothetical protein